MITYPCFSPSSTNPVIQSRKKKIKKSNYPKPHTMFVFSFLIKGMSSSSRGILLKRVQDYYYAF